MSGVACPADKAHTHARTAPPARAPGRSVQNAHGDFLRRGPIRLTASASSSKAANTDRLAPHVRGSNTRLTPNGSIYAQRTECR